MSNVISFRPLAGINCNSMCFRLMNRAFRFRPLAGINCNRYERYH